MVLHLYAKTSGQCRDILLLNSEEMSQFVGCNSNYLIFEIRLGLYMTLRISDVNIRSTKWKTQEQSVSHNPDVR